MEAHTITPEHSGQSRELMRTTGQMIIFFCLDGPDNCAQVSAICLCGMSLCAVRRHGRRLVEGRQGRHGVGDRMRRAHGCRPLTPSPKSESLTDEPEVSAQHPEPSLVHSNTHHLEGGCWPSVLKQNEKSGNKKERASGWSREFGERKIRF